MNYTFPEIRHIDDVLPYVTNCEDFVVADRGDFIVINYNTMSSDTFRPLTGDPKVDRESLIRRECRGIMFDKRTGKIIRRPLHKFFNVNEREETMSGNVDLTRNHSILTKLDGSMIAPFITSNGVFYVGTKMGQTDIALEAAKFMGENGYNSFCVEVIQRGCTPIFEWMSQQNRIVIDYGKPQLTLLAIRHMITGEYLPVHARS